MVAIALLFTVKQLLSLFGILAAFQQGATTCSNGFMEVELLQRRAIKIPSGSSSTNRPDGLFVLFPNLEFTCSGSITGFLLGVDIRTTTGSRNVYPELQLWDQRGSGTKFDKIVSQEIRLAAGNFSPDGVLQYDLTTPIQFNNGYMLGVYQPPESSSIVTFYQNSQSIAASAYKKTGNPTSSTIKKQDLMYVTNEFNVLLHPITTAQGCAGNFLNSVQLRQAVLNENINGITVRDRQQRVFPDISFTCNGSITKWIVGAGTGGGSSPSSEIQIWRKSGADSYTKVASTQLTAQSPSSDPNVYEYVPSSPLGFQEGDILGVYQREDSSVVPYYQESTGPQNLRQSGIVSLAANNLVALLQSDEYDYPLVTVETGPPISKSTPAITSPSATTTFFTLTSSASFQHILSTMSEDISSSTAFIQQSDITTEPATSKLRESTAPMATFSTSTAPETPDISTTIHRSSTAFIANSITATTPLPTSLITVTSSAVVMSTTRHKTHTESIVKESTIVPLAASASHAAAPELLKERLPILLFVVVGVTGLLVFLFSVVCAVTVCLIVYLRKGKGFSRTQVVNKSFTSIANPTYTGKQSNVKAQPLLELCNIISNHVTSAASTLTLATSSYEVPVSETYQWGIIVPTMAQREHFTHYVTVERVQSTPVSQNNSHAYQTLASSSFFEESASYWEPASDCTSIYQQFSERRYREIIREQIRVTAHLGSGQFGNVEKGVWCSPEGTLEVAIKTLKNQASEDERVKFLQEAAINGQFHHPNIVKLHGVVTVGEPVMIVLELVHNGDLRNYLNTQRIIPGEMVPSSLPYHLLGYCRQIASGMEYLSKKSFVHRDLAARNILVDNERTCKIADFGMSRDLFNNEYYVCHGGKVPIKWTAPEALEFKKYSTASDVWSFGVVMYEIWSLGHKPYENSSNYEVMSAIAMGYRLPPPPGCPRSMYQLMIDCWHPQASGRLSFGIVVSRLSQPEHKLLKWTDRDKSVTHPQSTMLGAPLETASDLHSDLQQQYM